MHKDKPRKPTLVINEYGQPVIKNVDGSQIPGSVPVPEKRKWKNKQAPEGE